MHTLPRPGRLDLFEGGVEWKMGRGGGDVKLMIVPFFILSNKIFSGEFVVDIQKSIVLICISS